MNLPKTMKAAVVPQLGKPLEIREVPVPEVTRGRVLVKIKASGVCHTDLHAANGDWPIKPTAPFIPGHEGVGEIVAVGEGVDFVHEGQRVGVPWLHTACGHCEHCQTGWETLCEKQQCTGYTVNGGFAEYVLADPTYVGFLPDNLEYAPAAPILCAGVTTYKGLKESEVRPGEWCAIVGIGGLGHIAVQYAKAMGMKVCALARSQSKLDLAKALGADLCVNATDPNAAIEEVQDTIGGVHGALVTAVTTKAFDMTLRLLRRRGTMSLVGLPPGDFPTPIFDVVLKRITIRGSIVGTRKDLQESLDFAGEKRVIPHLKTDRVENINEIFADMEAGKINGRIVLDFENQGA